MKKIIYITILIIFSSQTNAQNIHTTNQWQDDLRYLQDKVHKDYSNLFHKITKDDFDKTVEAFYTKIPSMQDAEIKVAFAELVALFGYGHTALWLTGWQYNSTTNFLQLPYNLYWFEDGIFIQGVHKDYKESIGAQVIKIENMPIASAIDAVKSVVSSENDQFFKGIGLSYLGVPEVMRAKNIITDISKVTLTLEKNGKQFEVTFKPFKSNEFPGSYGIVQTQGDWLAAHPSKNTPLWLKNFDEGYYYEYIEETKTVFVRQSTVFNGPESIEIFYKRVFEFIENNDVEMLIIDLRLNGGGNNHNNKSVITGIIQSKKINQKGRLFVVLGRRTFSAAQNLVNEIENYTQAIFVGEPTAENVNFYGDARFETLPNSQLPIRLSWAWWQDMNPRDTRVWTAPHIPVELSFKDYRSNYDPIIQTISLTAEIEIKINDFFDSNNIEEFKKYIEKYSKDVNYGFYNFEAKVNAFGYQLINIAKIDDAISIFLFNTVLYPESQNVWDSLAESYWKSGNIVKAKEFYNKVINMDPNGHTAENAKNMLSEM